MWRRQGRQSKAGVAKMGKGNGGVVESASRNQSIRRFDIEFYVKKLDALLRTALSPSTILCNIP